MRLMLDTGGGFAEVNGSRASMYVRDATNLGSSGTVTKVMTFGAGDKIKVQFNREVSASADVIQLLADGSGLVVFRIGSGGTGGGGGGTPAGSDHQIQFNDNGAFGADADFTWNDTTNVLDIEGDVVDITTLTYKSAYNNGNSGAGTWTFDLNNGQKQFGTLTGNATFAFTAPNGPGNFVIVITQDGTGSRTPSWPSSNFFAPSGTAGGNGQLDISALQNTSTVISIYSDGTDYWAMASGPMKGSVTSNMIN